MNNIAQVKHQKIFPIAIKSTTDVGSGVKSLQIYAQATVDKYVTTTNENADFKLATLIGTIYDADNTPSYTTLGSTTLPYLNNQLLLRNKSSKPITSDSDKIPKHNANNLYLFEFDNYINGMYYNIWLLSVDKAGNKELLKPNGQAKSELTPTFSTIEALVDDLAPEFDNITTLPTLTWTGTNYKFDYSAIVGGTWVVGADNAANNANSFLQNRIITFTDGGKRTRYITSASKISNTTEIILTMDIANLPGNASGDTYLLPLTTIKGGVGYLELEYPLSQSVNFDKYKIERSIANLSSNPTTDLNLGTEQNLTGVTWELVGYCKDNKYIDRGLVINKANLEGYPNTKKFLYRVTPISKWMNGSFEIAGQEIYSTIKDTNTVNYRPSAGSVPNPILPNTTNPVVINNSITNNTDGSITLEWNNSVDTNGDLKGYEIQRQRIVGSTAEIWTTVSSLKKEDYSSGTSLDKKFIDDGLEPNKPNNIKYKYQIRAFDWAGNVSSWFIFNNNTAIASTDTTAPLVSGTNSSIVVKGKIGGWKGQISFTDTDVKAVDIWAKRDHLLSSVDGSAEKFVGRFAVAVGETKIDFVYLDAPSNIVWYAKFDYKLIDKYNNESDRKGGASAPYTFSPSSAVPSETPQAVIDAFAPSVSGFTVTPSKVLNPYDDDSISISVLNTASKFKIKIATNAAGTSFQGGIGTDELVGKQLIFRNTGETVTILSNLASNSSSPYSVEVTLSSALSATPALNDIVNISPTHVNILIDKQNEVSGTSSANAADTTFAEIIDTTKSWATDQWKGWDLSVNGETTQIESNTATKLILDKSLAANPQSSAYTIKVPSDISGYNIFRGKVSGGTVESWVLISDTKSPFAGIDKFNIIDRNISVGTYKYGVTAYDLNGNESSPIKQSTSTVAITDVVAPGIPNIQGVVGGAGSLLIYWNRTADDIAYYKLTILDKNSATVLAETSVLGESYTLYGVTESKINIKKYKYKIVAYDTSGNAISGTVASAISDSIEYLDDYVPSTVAAPNPITSLIIRNHLQDANYNDVTDANGNVIIDNDGNADLVIPKSSITDHTTKLLVIERNTKSNVQGSVYGGYIVIATLQVPSLDNSDVYVDDVHFHDLINDRVTAKYRVKSISFGGAVSPYFTDTNEYAVTDTIGYDLGGAALGASILPDVGKVFMKFKDVIDKNSATYEIWRTSDTTTSWNSTNLFSDTTIQPRVVDGKWEKIATLPSTLKNNTQTDYVQYSDLDWQVNGTIDSNDTTLSLPYDAKAVYAVIGVDRWGNRGTPFFLPNGTNDANSVIYVPHEPRVNRIEKDALYANFNKGVQLNRGDTPINSIDAILHKGYGIEVLGDLKYNLDKFNGDYSLVVRRLQKSFTDLNIANIIDVFVYDTSTDNINYNNITFPQVALFVASATDVKLYEYNSMTLKDTFVPTLTNGVITKIYFKNGKLYVGSSSSVSAENYIKDYPANTVSVMHNSGSNTNDIYICDYNGSTYEIASTNSKVTIYNGANTIKSAGNEIYKNVTVRKGYVYVFKDIYVYKSKVTLSNMDFSIDNVEVSLFDIFMEVGGNLKSLIGNNDNLLIADNVSVHVFDSKERKLKVGQMLNTLIPFIGNGVLCGIFEQIINDILLTEDDMILLTEDNYKIII